MVLTVLPGQRAAAAWETLGAHSQASSLRQKHGGARHRVFDQSLQVTDEQKSLRTTALRCHGMRCQTHLPPWGLGDREKGMT